MNEDNPKSEILDFESRKSAATHAKKEQKLKAMQEAFKKALPLGKKPKPKLKKRKTRKK